MVMETPENEFDPPSLPQPSWPADSQPHSDESATGESAADPLAPASTLRRIVLPGLEAGFWTVATFIVVFSGGMVAMLGYLVYSQIVGAGDGDSFADLATRAALPMALGSQISLLVFAVVAAWMRYGIRLPDVLQLARPSWGHLLVVLGLTLPVQYLADAWARLAMSIFERFGISLSFDDYLQNMEQIIFAGPPVLIWLLIAVAPAIGEELMFRGLIGNALMRNWKPWIAVGVTSVLFGLMHVLPVQVIAVIPLGIAMHYCYLMTRSFWAPVLLHLANNSLALYAMSSGDEEADLAELAANDTTSLAVIGVSLVTTAAFCTVLWKSRRLAADTALTTADDGSETDVPADHPGLTATTLVAAAIGVIGVSILVYYTFWV